MPLIVDTYNVLHVVGVLPPELAGIDVAGLIELIASSRYRRERVVLVCDGAPRGGVGAGRRGHVAVRYAGSGRTADDVIAALVRRSTVPRRQVIVSSDRAVAREARRRRCRVLGADAFLRQLVADRLAGPRRPGPAPSEPPGRLSPEEVEAWAAEFDRAAPPDDGIELPPVLRPDADARQDEGDGQGAGRGTRTAAGPGTGAARRGPGLPGPARPAAPPADSGSAPKPAQAPEPPRANPPDALPREILDEADRLWREGEPRAES